MTSSPIVILSGARTPIGKLSGSLASFSATQLGGVAIEAALEKAGLFGEQIDYVYMGHVLQAGAGQITARQAAVNGGIPMSVPATTVNKVCLSGLDAIYQADRRIRSGDADIVVAGGMESMTNAPHLLPGARSGYRIGDGVLVDSMMYDGLYCAFDQCAMGEGTEKYAQAHGLIREHMDAMAAESHRRADAAQRSGLFADEIVTVTIPQRRGDACRRGPRRRSPRGDHHRVARRTSPRVRHQRPHHRRQCEPDQRRRGRDGHHDRGGRRPARRGPARRDHQLRPGRRTRRVAPPPTLPAIKAALDRAGLGVGDVDLFEINEAFAAVGVASADELGISMDIVNVNGGAIAVGHPLGMSGNRIALHLALELARRGGGIGAAALCGGGGQGDAILLRVRS